MAKIIYEHDNGHQAFFEFTVPLKDEGAQDTAYLDLLLKILRGEIMCGGK